VDLLVYVKGVDSASAGFTFTDDDSPSFTLLVEDAKIQHCLNFNAVIDFDCPCEGEMNADALHMQMKQMAYKIVAKAIVAFLQLSKEEGARSVVVS